MGNFPGLSPGDPQNFLSADARRRIGAAINEASILRARVLSNVETRFKSLADQSGGFHQYCLTGKPAIDLAGSFLRSAEIIMTAEVAEYHSVGIYGLQLQEIVDDLIQAACNSFELSGAQRNLLREEFHKSDPSNLSWAVCQRPSSPTLQQSPRLFPDKESAQGFLAAELFTGVRNEHQGWQLPVPVVSIIRTGEMKGRTFQQFLPVDQIAKSIPPVDPGEFLRIMEGTYPEVSCALANDWWFAGIVRDAGRRIGHNYAGREHGSVSEIILRAVYDLESSLTAKFGTLPNAARADFFRSWNLWNYVAEFAAKVGESSTAIQVAGNWLRAKEQASRITDVLFEQFCVYAHELVPSLDLTEDESSKFSSTATAKKNDCARRAQVDDFLLRCNQKSGHRVRRRHIWLAAGHSKGRQFEYWQACDSHATGEDERNFGRILKTEPVAFIALLKQKQLLPPASK
jgi:hypothetical protein